MSTFALLLFSYMPDIIQPMVDTKAVRGLRIQEAILNSGKTQREIAELIGVAPQSITKWIKTGKIYIDNLQLLADVTGVDMRYIVSGQPPTKISEPRALYQTNRSDLLTVLDQLDAQQAHKLLMCARAILDGAGDIEVSISIGGQKLTS